MKSLARLTNPRAKKRIGRLSLSTIHDPAANPIFHACSSSRSNDPRNDHFPPSSSCNNSLDWRNPRDLRPTSSLQTGWHRVSLFSASGGPLSLVTFTFPIARSLYLALVEEREEFLKIQQLESILVGCRISRSELVVCEFLFYFWVKFFSSNTWFVMFEIIASVCWLFISWFNWLLNFSKQSSGFWIFILFLCQVFE